MLPASGWTTASANAVATAASTALPPPSSTSMPICDAIAFCDATIPFFARTGTDAAKAAWAASSIAAVRAWEVSRIPGEPRLPLLSGRLQNGARTPCIKTI